MDRENQELLCQGIASLILVVSVLLIVGGIVFFVDIFSRYESRLNMENRIHIYKMATAAQKEGLPVRVPNTVKYAID